MLKLPFRLVWLPVRIVLGTIRLVGVRRLLLIGIGVGIGMLISPASGAEMRKRLEAKLVAHTPDGDTVVAVGAHRLAEPAPAAAPAAS